MIGERKIIALQLVILIILGFFAYNISEINSSEDNDNGSITVSYTHLTLPTKA